MTLKNLTTMGVKISVSLVLVLTLGGCLGLLDALAPTVVATAPTNGATGVAVNVTITATFSEAMNPTTINASTFTLTGPGGSVTGSVSYSGVTATFTPTTSLAPNTQYTATITTGAKDLAGNALQAAFSWSFTTAVTAGPNVDFSALEQTVAESVGTVTVTVVLNATTDQTVLVPYTVGGTATGGGVDHNLSNGTIAITAGTLSGSVSFTVVDDALDEGNETVVLTMGTPTNAALGVITAHTVTITDDDPTPTVEWSAASQTVAESVGTVTVTATLSAVSGRDVTVPYTVGGTATGGGVDHDLADGTLTIPAGTTTADVTFTVIDDALDEADETVILTMGAPTNATLGAITAHTVTITDDDPTPTVEWTTDTQIVLESVGTVTVTATLSAVSGQDVTVPYTVGGTATGGGVDFTTPTPNPLIIPAGSLSASLTFTVIDDALAESAEAVVLTIGAPTNAVAGTVIEHTVLIVDND